MVVPKYSTTHPLLMTTDRAQIGFHLYQSISTLEKAKINLEAIRNRLYQQLPVTTKVSAVKIALKEANATGLTVNTLLKQLNNLWDDLQLTSGREQEKLLQTCEMTNQLKQKTNSMMTMCIRQISEWQMLLTDLQYLAKAA